MITKRNNIREIREVIAFLRAAEKRAREKGALSTAFALRNALQQPAIARLQNGDLLKKANPNLKNLIQFSQNKETAFPLQILLDDLEKNAKSEGPAFQTLQLIGEPLKDFNNLQETLSRKEIPANNLTSQIAKTLADFTHDATVLPGEFALNPKVLRRDLSDLSFQIKPTSYKTVTLTEFKTLSQLKDYLLYIYNHDEDYHLTESPATEAILQFVQNKIQEDTELDYFQDAIEIVTLVNKIEDSRNRNFKGNAHLESVLEVYKKLVAILLKQDIKNNVTKLSDFFKYFSENEYIQEKEAAEKSQSGFFTPTASLSKTINKLKNFHEHFLRESQAIKDQISILSYTQLLQSILEGKSHSSLMTLDKQTNTEEEDIDSLLPDTEYPIIEEEIGPRFIGINGTMTFNPKQSRSILDLFRTKEIIRDFIRSFPWSINLASIDRLRTAEYDPELNLLGLNHIYPPQIQLMAIRFLLTSLDALGKVVGQDGELAIVNFNLVKEIIDSLQNLQKQLEVEYPTPEQEEKIMSKLNMMVESVQKMDENLFHSSTVQTHENTQVNTFCYLNLLMGHLLTNQPFTQSGLSPAEPPLPVLEMINKTGLKPKH